MWAFFCLSGSIFIWVWAMSRTTWVLFDLVQSTLLGSFGFSPFFLVFSESQFLGFSPVLVESSFALVGDVFSPDGFEGSESSWGFDVSDDTNANHWWAIDDGT